MPVVAACTPSRSTHPYVAKTMRMGMARCARRSDLAHVPEPRLLDPLLWCMVPSMASKSVRFANRWQGRRLDRIRGRLADLIRTSGPVVTAIDEQGYRDAEHVFLFGVCGRSSTTALMRMLNSTQALCMWGEPGDHVVDDLLHVITALRKKNDNPDFHLRKEILQRAFRENDHKVSYAMAFPEQGPALARLEQAFIDMFRPVIDVRRFGFKEITVRSIETLENLRTMFPAAAMVYVFRDPRTQWPSVEKMRWDHVATLDLFLGEYERLATIYMKFGGWFIETTALRDKARIARLASHLHLPAIDERLVNDGVFAMRDKKPLADDVRQAIERSPAFACYEQMRQREAAAFGVPVRAQVEDRVD